MIPVVDVGEKAAEITEPWSPVDVAFINDQVIRLALFHGEYHWHRHGEEDELFYVVKGGITIRPSVVLLFEPRVLKSRGD
jgi:mannose-6-phosphate isomerase-like protein (cupin superfamily)